MLCTWARDHAVTGTGVDISTAFLAKARERAQELGVADRVDFVHADAGGFVAEQPVDIAACIGATWIGSGVAGTVELLRRSRWLDANPDDELAPQLRAELDTSPSQHVRYRREYLGWGVFALMDR